MAWTSRMVDAARACQVARDLVEMPQFKRAVSLVARSADGRPAHRLGRSDCPARGSRLPRTRRRRSTDDMQHLKATTTATDQGMFTALAAAFGNVDRVGDRIIKGAFAE